IVSWSKPTFLTCEMEEKPLTLITTQVRKGGLPRSSCFCSSPLKLSAQFLIRCRKVFRVDAGFTDGCHEVCVANPARKDVHVEVVCHACSGCAPQIHSDIEAVRTIDFA